MTSIPLNYADELRRHRPRWPWRTIGVVVAVLLLGFYSLAGTFTQVESGVDPVTGSMTWKTSWPLGITSAPRTGVSPLETRLKRSGIAWTPTWRCLHNTHRNLFGRAICFECSSTPPICHIRPVLKGFADGSTDAELREFVRVLQTGTEVEQNAAVEAAGEKGLQVLSGMPPRGW